MTADRHMTASKIAVAPMPSGPTCSPHAPTSVNIVVVEPPTIFINASGFVSELDALRYLRYLLPGVRVDARKLRDLVREQKLVAYKFGRQKFYKKPDLDDLLLSTQINSDDVA
jgi:hypothetical protein